MSTLIELLILASQHSSSYGGGLGRYGEGHLLLQIIAITTIWYDILRAYRIVCVGSFSSSIISLQIIIDLFEALALVQYLTTVLLVQSEWLNLPTALLQVLREHLRQKVSIVVLAACGDSNRSWVIFYNFPVLVLQ